MDKPNWWPECPYPEDIFPMDRATAISHLPTDPMLRTAVAGTLGRIFWEIASDTIFDRLESVFSERLEGTGE